MRDFRFTLYACRDHTVAATVQVTITIIIYVNIILIKYFTL